ncbi:hypothetical protein GJ496_002172 [Pomphorhynchus laevis]|nr:hypothetical protein GJ496_002172 [Pomphorhynchus laevis]
MATNDDQMRLSVLAARRLCTGRRSLSCSDLFILEDCLAEELTCAICMDIIDSPMLTACGHVFCVTCINLSLRELCHCPMCKALLTFDMIYPCYPLKSIADQIRKVRISRQAMLDSSNNDNDNLILLKKLMSKSDVSDNSKNNRIVEALDINDGNKYSGRRRSSIGQDIILAMTFMTVISNPDSDGFNTIQQIDGERSEMDSWSRCLQMMYKLKNALIDTYIVDKTKQTGSNPTPLKNLALALQKVVKYDHLRELYCWKQNNCLDCGTAQIVTSLSCSKLNGCCAMSIVTRKINTLSLLEDGSLCSFVVLTIGDHRNIILILFEEKMTGKGNGTSTEAQLNYKQQPIYSEPKRFQLA